MKKNRYVLAYLCNNFENRHKRTINKKENMNEKQSKILLIAESIFHV